MIKSITIIACLHAFIFAGEMAIPKPEGLTSGGIINHKMNFMNIGDFDGDGSDDILVIWAENVTFKKTITVYSAMKSSYLLAVTSWTEDDKIMISYGDYLGTGKSCLVFDGKLYSF